jgi:hypothetical protein
MQNLDLSGIINAINIIIAELKLCRIVYELCITNAV